MPTELSVVLPNRPGSLASLAEALGKGGVNIESIAAVPVGNTGDVRLIVSDAAKARAALAGGGIECRASRDVLSIDLADQPGELGRVARKLADAGVNIDAVYVLGQKGDPKQIALWVPDVAKARSAIGG